MKSDGHCITLTPDDIYTVLSEEALHISVCVQEEHFRDFSLYFFIKGFWRDYHVWKVGHWTVRAHARAHIHNAHFFTECVVIYRCLCGVIHILVCMFYGFFVKLSAHRQPAWWVLLLSSTQWMLVKIVSGKIMNLHFYTSCGGKRLPSTQSSFWKPNAKTQAFYIFTLLRWPAG